MNLKITRIIAAIALLLLSKASFSQDFIDKANISGNIYSEASYYLEDTLIGAYKTRENIGANIYGNILYRYKGLSAGVRYEAYLPQLVGFDSKFEGMGIAHRYVSYSDSLFDVSIGNYYEQFGSGLVLRTYEDKNLGIDNALDGFRAVIRPLKGVTLKAVIGKQRYYWESGPGTVRGLDAEWNVLQLLKPESATNILVGGSAVSRYQPDDDPLYILPENVAAYAGRMSLTSGGFFVSGEYAQKINDPSATNSTIYKSGQALVATTSYSQKGIGILFTGKWVDNMDFRSSRNATSNDLTLSYIPSTSLQHTYSLPGMYPYATQPTGEASLMGQVNYQIRKNSKLGGKYGTNIQLSASVANSINKQKLNDTTEIETPGTLGYKTSFLSIGNEKYFHEVALEISRKINKNLKTVAGATTQFYNLAKIQGHPGEESVRALVVYADVSYKFLESQNIRIEAQHLSTKQDNGNWAMLLAEYSIAPRWSFAISDQFNYGNPENERRKHYYLGSVSYSHASHRVSVRFGKQSEGVVCIGGVCRLVPASYAASVVLSTSF
jgi:hypothetical protein